MCDVKCWESTYLSHKLLRDVDLQFVTEYVRKLATVFLKDLPLGLKGRLRIHYEELPLHFGGHL